MNAPSKTVLSLICLNPNKFGSYEEFELRLTRRMTTEGIRHVETFLEYPPDDLKRQFEEAGAVFDVLPLNGRKAFYQQAARLIRRYQPEVVHISFFPFLTPLTHLARLCGVRKVLYTDHSSGMPSQKNKLKGAVFHACNRFCASGMERVIAVSQFVGRRLVEVAKVPLDRVRVVYNGINTERFSPVKIQPEAVPGIRIPSGRPLFAAVSNLITAKGIAYYLQAARLMVQRGSQATFLIIGGGVEQPALEHYVAEQGLQERVVFAGIRSDVERFLQCADIFVCPSVWEEAFGLANVEAMACGLPVVSTRVGAIPEVVQEGKTGFLVPPADAGALAEAMEKLAVNPALCADFGNAGRRRAQERFNLDRMVEETFTVYQEILK